MRNLISYQPEMMSFLFLRRHCGILQCGNHRSLVGTSRAKNKFPSHLQTTLLKIGYCNQYKFFHFYIFTVNLNIHRFFAWSTSAECSELYCNAPIKTVNGDVIPPKTRNGGTTHKGKLHMLQASWKQGIMHRETPYTMQHSVYAFATLPAQFALFMSPF